MPIGSLLLKSAKLTIKGVSQTLGAVAEGAVGLKDGIEEFKLRLLILLNREEMPLGQQLLDAHWNAGFAEASQHGGER